MFKPWYNISVAAERFSGLLTQFGNPHTDVILLGHSMGDSGSVGGNAEG